MTAARPDNRAGAAAPEAGFSLLEILIALAILALAMTVVGVSFGRSGVGYRFEAAAQDLALSLREAQVRALRSGRDVAVAIDVDARTYSLQRETAVQLPAEMGVEVVSAGQLMDAGKPVFSFMPDGGSSGGAITLTLQGHEATINIDWLTGAVALIEGGANGQAP